MTIFLRDTAEDDRNFKCKDWDSKERSRRFVQCGAKKKCFKKRIRTLPQRGGAFNCCKNVGFWRPGEFFLYVQQYQLMYRADRKNRNIYPSRATSAGTRGIDVKNRYSSGKIGTSGTANLW